jgi:hypothetical protein
MPNKTNLNRLAFTANNFYDSRNMLASGQQYGVRPSLDGSVGNQNQGGGNGGGANQSSGQSRSRQKMMKTNTYGVMQQQPGSQQSPGQIQHQNSFGAG